MTVKEMASEYYPRLWNKDRLQTLVDAGRLTQEDMDEITGEKTSDSEE